MHLILDIVRPCLQVIRGQVMIWSAKRPALALTTIITICVMLLPLITTVALMPIVFLLDIRNFVATKGVLYVFYMVLVQGVLLGVVLVILFLIAFCIATSVSVLHSYQPLKKIEKQLFIK